MVLMMVVALVETMAPIQAVEMAVTKAGLLAEMMDVTTVAWSVV